MSAHPEGLTHESYLGDGAYVGFDGYYVVIYTTDGIQYTRPVYMEPGVLESFLRWSRDFRSRDFKRVADSAEGTGE